MPQNIHGLAVRSLNRRARRGGGRRLLACLAVLGSVAVARAEVSCPDQLEVEQRAQAPSGWSIGYSDIPPRLSGVTLFDGPPANRVSLKYDRRRQTAKELILTWVLRDSPRSHYLLCSYERTTAQINTALPPGSGRCDVVFDRTTSYPGGGLPVKRMVCQ
jgi:purine nucleoside permease